MSAHWNSVSDLQSYQHTASPELEQIENMVRLIAQHLKAHENKIKQHNPCRRVLVMQWRANKPLDWTWNTLYSTDTILRCTVGPVLYCTDTALYCHYTVPFSASS